MRVLVVVGGEGRWQVVWGHHHLLLDGWSVAIVLGEVFAAYRALAAGGAAGEAPVVGRRPFRDFVAWANGLDAGAAAGFWQERLAGIGAAAPVGVERVTGQAGPGERRVRLTAPAAALDGFARRHRVTVNTVVQGAWAVLLAAYGGSDDVVFGVTTSGRGEQLDGMEGMVGLLINTTPARVRLERDAPVAAWLRRLQREQAEAREFEQTPLVDIAAAAGVPAGQPLFTTLFIFENYPSETLNEPTSPGATRGNLNVAENYFNQAVSYPLAVVAGSGQRLKIDLAYDRARFDHAVIERTGAHLVTLLRAMAEDPGQPVGDLSMLAPGERDQLLTAWNDTAAPVPGAAGAGELVAEQAVRRPDAIAVVYGRRSLGYAKLGERAGRLAHYLQSLGVGPETVVGLCLERGLDMIVAMLAVWQAGGAYLPLDPDYPPDPAGPARLRDVHLRLHRAPQGDRRVPPRHRIPGRRGRLPHRRAR
jgi:non-ribosomal peptide synthetase component F